MITGIGVHRRLVHNAILQQFNELLQSPGDEQRLSEFAKFGPVILQEWENLVPERPKVDLEWLARIYSAISDTDTESGAHGVSHPTHEVQDEEDIEIGHAFRAALLADLPAAEYNFSAVFREAPKAEPGIVEKLRADPSVVFGGPNAEALVEFGLTPSTFVDASSAMGRLMRRFYRQHQLSELHRIRLDRDGSLTPSDFIDEVLWTIGLPEATVSRLVDWILRVAGSKRFILNGFETEYVEGRLTARPSSVERGIWEQWQSPLPNDVVRP